MIEDILNDPVSKKGAAVPIVGNYVLTLILHGHLEKWPHGWSKMAGLAIRTVSTRLSGDFVSRQRGFAVNPVHPSHRLRSTHRPKTLQPNQASHVVGEILEPDARRRPYKLDTANQQTPMSLCCDARYRNRAILGCCRPSPNHASGRLRCHCDRIRLVKPFPLIFSSMSFDR